MLNAFRRYVLPAGMVMACAGTEALAAQPEPWQILMQPPASPVMERMEDFNTLISVIIILITVLVLALLVYVAYRFNARKNPVPSKRSHHATLEVLWTAVPIVILVIVAIPSIRLLYFQDKVADADMTIKVTGHQWYWSYEYPDNGGFGFDAFLVPEDELKEGQPRLLETDNHVVLPVDTDIRILVTGADVIHSWAVPAFGIKSDAVPGRVRETWVRINDEGLYYGQCSELCGVNHGFMPITVEAVSKQAFKEWVAKAQQEFASTETETPRVAEGAARVQ